MILEYFRWLYRWFQIKVLAIPGRVIALVFAIFLVFFPLITANPYTLSVLITTALFAIYAASWDLLSGFTGQLNLGHALFFGISGYTSALLNIHFGLSPWVTIPIGCLAAMMVGLVVCIPALRLRGFYLALVTLSLPIILTAIIYAFSDFTGGELGLYGLDGLSGTRIFDYYIVMLVMFACVFAMYKLTDVESKIIRVGVILHTIREDEIAARACGIDTTRYKILAFVVSGFFAGIAGGLYTHYVTIAGPSTLALFFSFQAILWSIFGGITTIYGAVAGVYILYPLMQFLSLSVIGRQIHYIIFALILIFTLFLMPEGLTIWVRDKIEVKCQRCKLINRITRGTCRACGAPLHMEKKGGNKNEIHLP